MSLEILDQLEEKIRQAVETIQLLQLEVEELKEHVKEEGILNNYCQVSFDKKNRK